MSEVHLPMSPSLRSGVMLNAYPDSIGRRLSDTIDLLRSPEFQDAFSLFYVLPTFFNSDLDRGFSIIDYDINPELVSVDDLQALDDLGIQLKLDLVLNHLSVGSPQFQDLLRRGDDSPYKDFFIDWNDFWEGHGGVDDDGKPGPTQEQLEKLFLRKPELPILHVTFPDGSQRAYWNTFYQKVEFEELRAAELAEIEGLSKSQAEWLAKHINQLIADDQYPEGLELDTMPAIHEKVHRIVAQKRRYLGQMDLNARSELVWEFYDETLRKLKNHGAKIIRLDAFAYLHKEPGQPNFFNRPGTWDYLRRLRSMSDQYGLIIFPEIHAEYGAGIHEEISEEGYPIYDFFFPGLVIDALDRGTNVALVKWISEILAKQYRTINMLGCHDGIPVLDLRGKYVDGTYRPGLLQDECIEDAVQGILDRGGRTKNLYDASGKKLQYYQINATFFSALGEEYRKLVLARAVQMFMPGIPQVWYLDLFAGRNDNAAADAGGPAGHKEINRTNLSLDEVRGRMNLPVVLDQLDLIRLRNNSPAFLGEMRIEKTVPHELQITWEHPEARASLHANLHSHDFTVTHSDRNQKPEIVVQSRSESEYAHPAAVASRFSPSENR